MAKSIAEQVQDYLKEHASASNQELYQAFPSVRQNTLRHYRSKFSPQPEAKEKRAKKELPKPKRGRPKKVGSELENRVVRLEKQMDQLLKTLDVEVGKRGRRVNPIDKRFKEFEDVVLKFLKARTAMMPHDLARLEELQLALSQKISSFINNLKKK
ncbi:MAG: hypothetical protein A2600_02415 [Candidatus Lambdaproteobacteria bacterium RIFOXYD1_FULL_56_27]|uniref:Uncharacterized protein n=1 Tax=Candidatus Lambdaproteobacteria bacterium RIFOXYD2_FULL_56_26 TaxID=1817773 RepID=A0A1F6H2W8_9PROT|nr:MAG: hypothetical protein A2557_06480 [Candidatus Lambdaproteobacteria bacterium RIFOXYD2_FULL_56_26]OGH09098.1 MAG: hypothetical protein A2600_02415 [Candidatus Lambdaproteobacteria bacterium RIFOXYD1_FULL_56_27]